MDEAPAVAEAVGVVAFHMKPFAAGVLQNGDGVVAAFDQQVHRLGPELRGIKAVKQNGPAAALGVADFAGEDGLLGGFAAPIKLEIPVANHLDQLRAQRLGRAAQHHVAAGVRGFGFRAQFAALLVHDAFAADDDDVFLQVVECA